MARDTDWWVPYEEASDRGAVFTPRSDALPALTDALLLDLPPDPELLIPLIGKEQ